jgi:hypothetical protein
MTIKLLPVEVDLEEIQDAKSATITVEVINAYAKAAGDFAECIPFCLLRFAKAQVGQRTDNPEHVSFSSMMPTLSQPILTRIYAELRRVRSSLGGSFTTRLLIVLRVS